MGKKVNYLKASIERLQIDIDMHSKVNNIFFRNILDACLLPFALLNNIRISKQDMKNIKYNFAVVVICKNEARYIIEWIEYYKIIGVDHFYIFDNDSSDHLKEVLKNYIENEDVTYIRITGKKRQYDAYNMALNKYGKLCKYMAFFDADEFLYCKEDIIDFLDNNLISNSAGLAVNWMIYGSSGYKSASKDLVISRFNHRALETNEKNLHTKVIVKPEYVLGIMNPHFAVYKRGYYSIDENNNSVYGPKTKEYSGNKFRLNHYFTKSYQEFKQKRERGEADTLSLRSMNDFTTHDLNNVFDNTMEQYAKKVAKRLIKVKGDNYCEKN